MAWTRERWSRIEELFHAASQREAADRDAYLESACAGDGSMRAAVVRLLEADAGGGDDDLIDQGVVVALRGQDPLLEQQFGPFRLVERIAEGGMGAVYRATRVEADFVQEVAVKVLRLGLSTMAMRDRFARERQTLARLLHPNIARLIDGGTTAQGVPFFAMELIDGVPLDRFCDDNRATIRQRLTLVATICRAVQFAHQNLIVHLDLKPSNILVDAHGVPKLVDFGVAGLLEAFAESPAATASTRSRPLTPEYASPELLRGEPVSTAADVYSLGVVLYEVLTGTRAFRPTRSDLDLMRAVCETDVVRPSATFATKDAEQVGAASPSERADKRSASVGELARALRGDLDRIVGRAMRKEPDRRYASCREFAEDIERYLQGFPVAAREAGVGYRASKFVRRNLVAVVAACTVVLALVGGVVSTLHMAQVARQERDLAAAATKEAETERDATAAAKRRVEHEADHARIEAISSRIVAGFLGDTFLSAQFLVDSGQRASVLGTIQRKADQVRRQHPDADHLRANLLDALGHACLGIDAFAEAEQLIVEAAAIRRACFGEHSLERALSLSSLSGLYHRQGRIAEAVEVARECYHLHKTCRVDVHTDVARAANDLAAIERAAGNVERARQLHVEALELRRAGGDPVLVAESLNNLANSEPDLERAREQLGEALRLRTAILGPGDPLTIQSEANLGTLAVRMGDFAAAREMLRPVVEKSRRLAGLGSDGLALTLRALGYAELRLGDLEASERAIDEALELDRQRLGPVHPRIAGLLEVRAAMLEQRRDWPEAAVVWRQILDIRRAALPAGHRLIAASQSGLGATLSRCGDVAAALEQLGEALASYEAASPRVATDLVDTRIHLALALERGERFEEAESALLAAHELCTADPDAAARAGLSRSHLREFYRRRGRTDDAARYEDPSDAPGKR